MDVTTIADYGDLCGECPLWDEAARVLYWTDCEGFKFYRYDPATGAHRIVRAGFEINGFRRNGPGGFVVTNNSGLWLWDGAGEPELIADRAEGRPLRLNDCVADPSGRLLCGSWFYDPQKSYPLGHLYRVDTDRRITVLDEGIHLANGLGFSPDARTLYFADSAARRIYAYDYDVGSGGIARRRVLVQVPASEGLPDGLTVDAEGFIWSAQWYGGCVVRYDPDGREERRVSLPAKQISAVTFGGEDLTDCFVTSAAAVLVSPLVPPGCDLRSENAGGQLFRWRSEVRGRVSYQTQVRL